MSQEYSQFERRLQSLSPAVLRIDRDGLLYAAGVRAGRRRARRAGLAWLSSAAAAAAAALLVVAILALPRARPGVAVNPEVGGVAPRDFQPEKPFLGWRPTTQPDPAQAAFSDIHNVDSWSPEELQRRGIAVRPGAHPLQSEDPPPGWVEVAFDPAHAPANLGIVMTAWFVADDGATEGASRAQADGAEEKPLSLRIAVEGHQRENSYVNILVWQPEPGGGSKAWGYRLSARRLLELAGVNAGADAAGAP